MIQPPIPSDPPRPTLREMRDDDLPEIAAQLSDPRVAEWLAAIRPPVDPAQAREVLAVARDPLQTVRLLELSGRVIGGFCIGPRFWYWLDPRHQGGGHMTCALHAALGACFATDGPPLIATCREDNAASVALLHRLGFSPRPVTRRLFFHGAGSAMTCRDHVMTPEQWHFLNPPRRQAGKLILRPARQEDLATVQQLLEGETPAPPWPRPGADAVRAFLERHRFRGWADPALWIVETDERRAIAMALTTAGSGDTHLRPARLEAKLRPAVRAALSDTGGA